jgi:hypothetical protein
MYHELCRRVCGPSKPRAVVSFTLVRGAEKREDHIISTPRIYRSQLMISTKFHNGACMHEFILYFIYTCGVGPTRAARPGLTLAAVIADRDQPPAGTGVAGRHTASHTQMTTTPPIAALPFRSSAAVPTHADRGRFGRSSGSVFHDALLSPHAFGAQKIYL